MCLVTNLCNFLHKYVTFYKIFVKKKLKEEKKVKINESRDRKHPPGYPEAVRIRDQGHPGNEDLAAVDPDQTRSLDKPARNEA